MRRLLLPLALLASASAYAQTDVSAAWISRLPEIPYVWDSANPKVDGWPVPGELVTWQGHVRNLGSTAVTVDYEWWLSGERKAEGKVAVPANGLATVDYPWTWTFDRHRLELVLDPDNRLAESEERNNRLTIFTDAISVGFWVEQSVWNAARQRMPTLGIGVSSFEDLMQLRVRRFNDMAAITIYPETPNGVLDRLRLEKVVIVPDKALPLSPVADRQTLNDIGVAAHFPDIDDRTVDLQW